ncbi:MAG: type II secretion system protein [Planctomycetota bacterium]
MTAPVTDPQTAATTRDRLRSRRGPRSSSRGFTLIEMLVTISLIVLIISLLMPGLQAIRAKTRAFNCKMNLRSIAFDFQVFADPALHGSRGDDARDPQLNQSRSEFWLETFIESQYRVDEFWDHPGSRHTLAARELEPLNCPEVRGEVVLQAETPCSAGAIQPPASVSYGFNLRLYRPEREIEGRWRPVPTPLNSRVLSESRVPLVWDIDGTEAQARDMSPHFSAPPIESDRPYSDGAYWFPGRRHGDCMNVALTSGEVICAEHPEKVNSIRWDWQPY